MTDEPKTPSLWVIVDFYGVQREVEVAPYLQVGTTVYGAARIDGVNYTLTKRQDETIWHIKRKWSSQ